LFESDLRLNGYNVADRYISHDYGYDDFLAKILGKDDLIIIEQDILSTVFLIKTLEASPCDWCTLLFWMIWRLLAHGTVANVICAFNIVF